MSNSIRLLVREGLEQRGVKLANTAFAPKKEGRPRKKRGLNSPKMVNMSGNSGTKKYTVKEAASYLGVSRTKISLLIKAGKLTAEVNPFDSRHRLIAREQLDKFKEFPPAKKLEEEA